jgi:hypothetical protein
MIDPSLPKFFASHEGRFVSVEPVSIDGQGEVDFRVLNGVYPPEHVRRQPCQIAVNAVVPWAEFNAVIRALEAYERELSRDTSADGEREAAHVRWAHERLFKLRDAVLRPGS